MKLYLIRLQFYSQFKCEIQQKVRKKTDFIVLVIKIDSLYRSLFGEYDHNSLEDPVVSKVWGEIDDRI